MSTYQIEFVTAGTTGVSVIELEAPDELTALFRAGYEAGFAGFDGLNARVVSVSS